MTGRMKRLISVGSEVELAIIRSILDAEGIFYVVENEHFGSLFSGPLSYRYNEKTILVAPEDEERARELLRVMRLRPAS